MYYKCQPILASRAHISNNLPLVLKPIGYKSKSHLLKVGFDLLLAQRLCKWVCHIICGVDSLDLNVTFLKVIADEMVSPFARNSSSTNGLPDVDFRSSISDMKSESVYPQTWSSPLPKTNIISLVLLKYLRIHFTEVQCSSSGFDWYLLVTLTAWAISGRVHSMAYMRLPIAEA